MPKRKFINASCGCEIPPTKSFASKNKCADCGNIFCDKHIYSYVDEANESITKKIDYLDKKQHILQLK